jgi:hypothetical protein
VRENLADAERWEDRVLRQVQDCRTHPDGLLAANEMTEHWRKAVADQRAFADWAASVLRARHDRRIARLAESDPRWG